MTATLCISSGKNVKFIFKVVRLLVTADCPPPFFLCLPSRVHPSKSNEITNDFLLRLSSHLSHLLLSLFFRCDTTKLTFESNHRELENLIRLFCTIFHLICQSNDDDGVRWEWTFALIDVRPAEWSFEHPGGLFMRTCGEFSEGYRVRCVCRRFVIYVETSRRRKRRGSKCRVSHCEDMFLIAQAAMEINQPEQRGFERM